jgi:hypothetical protein
MNQPTIAQTALAVSAAFAQGDDATMTRILLDLPHDELVLVAAQLAGYYVRTASGHAAAMGLPEEPYVEALLHQLGVDLATAPVPPP